MSMDSAWFPDSQASHQNGIPASAYSAILSSLPALRLPGETTSTMAFTCDAGNGRTSSGAQPNSAA
jgi:hypothetical protein